MGNPHRHGNSKDRQTRHICPSELRRRDKRSGISEERDALHRAIRKAGVW